MNVGALVEDAKNIHDVRFHLDGERILLDAPERPPTELLGLLQGHREEVRAWLKVEQARFAVRARVDQLLEAVPDHKKQWQWDEMMEIEGALSRAFDSGDSDRASAAIAEYERQWTEVARAATEAPTA